MELDAIMSAYWAEFERVAVDPDIMDPAVLDRHLPHLRQLASLGNVGVTVFDMVSRAHVFWSLNFEDLFGYDLARVSEEGNDYWDSRVHPEDRIHLLRSGIQVMRLYHSLAADERRDYKVVNEYRILNREERYVRILEQHQALELDPKGNVWLSLGVMDVSPLQDEAAGVRSSFINFKTGQVLQVDTLPPAPAQAPPLSAREREVLGLIGQGLLSKEIAERLFISVHTVNTHRQRILEKLNADNSMEAVRFARGLGLLG